jgi:uncharacterized protein (TIGR04255 family)
MPFPEAARTIYRRNPLVEVICQLRFPTILRVDAEREPAAQFQEAIRATFPLYEEIVPEVPLPRQLQQLLKIQGGQIERHFSSADQFWMASLTRDFIALSCRRYRQWEEFQQQFAMTREAVEHVYAPSFYSRVGLRYKNVIRRSRFNLQDVPWSELLQPHVAAEFSSAQVVGDISKAAHDVSFRLQQFDGEVQVRHGVIDSDGEQSYLIDGDFFTNQRTELNNVGEILNYFNEQTRRLFHWSITPRLHDAMEPAAVVVGG